MKTTYSRDASKYRRFLIEHIHTSKGYRHTAYYQNRVLMITHSLPLLYRYLHTLGPQNSDTTDRDRIITHKYVTNRTSYSDDISRQKERQKQNEDTTE